VAYRPYLKQFLEYLSANFEVILFTASENEYANLVVQKFDPQNKYFSHRLYREHCTPVVCQMPQDNFSRRVCFVKDLNVLNRDLKKTVIIDNSILAFAYNLSSGVPLPSFYGQPWDTELPMLVDILEDFRQQISNDSNFDVRQQLQGMFEIEAKIYSQ